MNILQHVNIYINKIIKITKKITSIMLFGFGENREYCELVLLVNLCVMFWCGVGFWFF